MLHTTHSNPSFVLSASETVQHTPPPWFPEMALMAAVWIQSGLLEKLQKNVRVTRGRMGSYDVCDFVLITLAYVCGHETSWSQLYRRLSDEKVTLSSLWARETLPSHSALSRFHDQITPESLATLQSLLFDDLLQRGIPKDSFGGLYSRLGNFFLMFDIDGTRQVMRKRSLISNAYYPPPQRRTRKLALPGYRGRKRGELVRTRTTLQQAHTQEWLGSYSGAGNGKPVAELELARQACCAYLHHHQVPTESAILRLDGLYGYAATISVLDKHRLGYISRSADYGLLNLLQIPERLAELTPWFLELADSNQTLELYDMGWIEWAAAENNGGAIRTRLLVRRSPAPKGQKKPKVGKKIGAHVYELFVTSLASEEFTVSDVISLYYGRGGFEKTLFDEDKEQHLDRWFSQTSWGQEWCQWLGLWVWNERLRQGFASKEDVIRCTLWSEPLEPASDGTVAEEQRKERLGKFPEEKSNQAEELSCFEQADIRVEMQQDSPEAVVEGQSKKRASNPEIEEPQQAPAALRTQLDSLFEPPIKEAKPLSTLTQEDFQGYRFTILDAETLVCPAGKQLRAQEKRETKGGQKQIRYRALASDCKRCEWESLCRPKARSGAGKIGRRVTLTMIDGELRAPMPVHKFPSRDAAQKGKNKRKDEQPRASLLYGPAPLMGAKPLLWYDLPARFLRCFLPALLITVGFDVRMEKVPEALVENSPKRFTRAERAHRRLSYVERLARNAQPKTVEPTFIHIYGLPIKISEYIDKLGENVRAP